jgi:hypothetical protein
VREDLLVDPVAHAAPPGQWGRERAFRRQAQATVEGHPAQDAGVEELVQPTAYLPDPRIGEVPMVTDPIQQPGEIPPQIMGDRLAVFSRWREIKYQ